MGGGGGRETRNMITVSGTGALDYASPLGGRDYHSTGMAVFDMAH